MATRLLSLLEIARTIRDTLPTPDAQALWRRLGGSPTLITMAQLWQGHDAQFFSTDGRVPVAVAQRLLDSDFVPPQQRAAARTALDAARNTLTNRATQTVNAYELPPTVGEALRATQLAVHFSADQYLLLARNPAALNALIALWRAQPATLDSTGQTYQRAVGAVLDQLFARERRPDEARAQFVRVLAALGQALVQGRWPNDDRSREAIVRKAGLNTRETTQALARAVEAGLLLARGRGETPTFLGTRLAAFFATYAVEALLATPLDEPALAALFTPWWVASSWADVFTMLAERTSQPGRVVRALAAATPEVALGVWHSADGGRPASALPADVQAALVAGANAARHHSHPAARAAAYRVLGWLGADARPGVLRHDFDAAAWCRIAAGPGGTLFWMARWPVTVAQWQACFPDDDTQRRKAPNQPVELTMPQPLAQAERYAAWLTERWRRGEVRGPASAPAGFVFRLPTQAEWDAAARGAEGRRYPWGDSYITGYANVDEATVPGMRREDQADARLSTTPPYDLGKVVPVGLYPPASATPEGVEELFGNVAEATRTPGPNAQALVTRGGHYSRRARTSLADADAPNRFLLLAADGVQNTAVGLRLVCALPAPNQA